jgi:hypothetical protein
MTAVLGGVIFVGAVGAVLFIRHRRNSNPTRKSSGGSAPKRDLN